MKPPSPRPSPGGEGGRGGTLALLILALFAASTAAAQNREAVRTKYKEPVYPDNLLKTQLQGNVLVVGRIDAHGSLTDLHAIAASNRDFVAPALEALKEWRFQPALRDGRPAEIFANVGVRFRLQSAKRGAVPMPILGDVAISPADESGRRTAPEGFPIRKGHDPSLRAEAVLDIAARPEPRTLGVKVEAISPRGRRIPVFQPPVQVAANATEVRIPVVARVGADWDEGVWMLQFQVDGKNAGGGQFWLASDPANFRFVIPSP